MSRPPGVAALVRRLAAIAFLIAGAGCSNPPPRPAAQSSASQSAPAAARITQFYATAPNLARGEKELLCYGVENAVSVHLAPPPQELSAALSRCVEVNPTRTTGYTLTAEGAAGPPASRELTVTVGPPHVKIIEVTVSALTVAPGDLVSLCYHIENAASVAIAPIHFHAASNPKGCGTDTPRQTTTYVVTAIGADGSRDQEQVTVKVR
ncbi:MAG TPA: hypothetical protein VME43_02540 [Bryobacteraceae bacterium]|nr:hypothetical protein [Bryobacteraceae bacterium]